MMYARLRSPPTFGSLDGPRGRLVRRGSAARIRLEARASAITSSLAVTAWSA